MFNSIQTECIREFYRIFGEEFHALNPQYRDKVRIPKLNINFLTNVLPIEYFVVSNIVMKTARPYFLKSTENC